MESSIVIKVKYGETLRRFNACVVDEELDLDMDGLREKVLRLFNFAPDADLMLTYIDEDGDVVTLADEEDLHDVVRQSLNPLRITVSLITEKTGISLAVSSGSSTPMKSPQVQPPLNTGVSDILKSVPGPFLEGISKLSANLASNSMSSKQGLSEIVDSLSRMGLSNMKQVDFHSSQNDASGNTMDALVSKDQKGSTVLGDTSEGLPNTKSEEPNLKDNQGLQNIPTLNSNEVELGNVTRSLEASVLPPPGSVNLNVSPSNFLFGYASTNTVPNNEEVKKLGEGHSSGKYDVLSYMNVTPVANNVPAGAKKKEIRKPSEFNIGGKSVGGVATSVLAGAKHKEVKKSSECHLGGKSVGVGASTSLVEYLRRRNLNSLKTDLGGDLGTKSANASGNSSGSCPGLNSINECPFSGTFLGSDSVVSLPQYAPPHVAPFKRSNHSNDGTGGFFHMGVCCDGCGANPITGPRFKSKVKENYDLCSICFAEMGNKTDYVVINHPLTYRRPLPFKGLYDPVMYDPTQHCRVRPPALPKQVLRGGMKPSRSKLDSLFIQDVNVLDGTIMAPSTAFTKIWRMKNNGTTVWPQGTQILWIGGDRLSEAISVKLEIPANGLPVDKELDIAVGFSAPLYPGRYISYWRIGSPSGRQLFGQRVWVLIQVDASLKDSLCESIHGFNLNLPPVGGGITGPQIVNVNVEPMVEDSLREPNNSKKATELVEPIVDAHANGDQELNFPINDTLLIGGSVLKNVPTEAYSTVSYPTIDFSEVAQTVPSPAAPPSTDVQASAQELSGNNGVEQTLLKELEEMGFKQVDLNKEILRMNEYDLEKSVDELCGVHEWDPILEELQEMGFCDDEMNKRLLRKNNGSIKRVVMDLINGEKA